MVSTWLISVTEWYTSQVLFMWLWLLYTYVLASYTVTVLVAVLVVPLLCLFLYFLSTHFCDFTLSLFVPPPSGWFSGLYLCTCCVLVMCVLQSVMCHEWLDEMQKAGIWIHTLPSIPPCPLPPPPPPPAPHWERPHCMQVEVFRTWVSSPLILVASSSFSLVCWCGCVETYVSYPCGVKSNDYLLNFIFIKENCCNCRIITRKG